MTTLTISLVAVMCVILGLAVREMVSFVRKRDSYSLRRLTLRMMMAVMLVFLLCSVLVGVAVFGLDEPGAVPRHWMVFWTSVAVLTGAILCLVMADLRLIDEDKRRDASELWRDIARTLADFESRRPKDH